jgi:site-specific DNA recombinase
MKAIILARVSDIKQDSNEAQLLRMKDYIRNKNLIIWKTYEIEESSTHGSRRKFQEVIKDIETSKEPIALVVDTVDRLQRSFRESVILDDLRKQGKLEIHFYRENLILRENSNSADLIRWDMAVMFARSYVLQLSDNVKRKIGYKLTQGEWINKPPIGYIGTIDENENKGMIPDPLRKHLVVKMFEMYATGNFSTQQIKLEMDKLGLRSNTRENKPLVKSQIHHILNNPFYYGVMRVNGLLYPHKYEPLISQNLFNRVRDAFRGHKKQPYRYGYKPFVFKALLRCAECGCLITGEEKKGKYKYYSCSNYKKVHKQRLYIREEDLFAPIKKTLKKLILKESQITDLISDLKGVEKSKTEFYTTSLKELRKEFDLYETRKSKLVDSLMDGGINKEIYDKKRMEYESIQSNLMTKISNFKEADEEYYITIGLLLGVAQRASELFDSSEPNEKRAIINFLLQNCQLDGKNLKFELKTPFDRVLEANSRSNMLRR